VLGGVLRDDSEIASHLFLVVGWNIFLGDVKFLIFYLRPIQTEKAMLLDGQQTFVT
jgi:hypothetical protein